MKKWGGEGASAGSWDEGGAGNQRVFDMDDGTELPAGTYVLEFTPAWGTYADSFKALKDVTIRVLSHSELGPLKILTEDQAVATLTAQKVEISHKKKNCSIDSQDKKAELGKNLTIQ